MGKQQIHTVFWWEIWSWY